MFNFDQCLGKHCSSFFLCKCVTMSKWKNVFFFLGGFGKCLQKSRKAWWKFRVNNIFTILCMKYTELLKFSNTTTFELFSVKHSQSNINQMYTKEKLQIYRHNNYKCKNKYNNNGFKKKKTKTHIYRKVCCSYFNIGANTLVDFFHFYFFFYFEHDFFQHCMWFSTLFGTFAWMPMSYVCMYFIWSNFWNIENTKLFYTFLNLLCISS